MSATESPDELIERLCWEREQGPSPAPGRRVAITGSRKRTPTAEEMGAFWRILATLEPVAEVHHGDCGGVDRYVAAEVERHRPDIKVVPHPAQWRPPGRPASAGPDRSAGPIRNRQMLVLVSDLVHFPGDKGTADCVKQGRAMGRRLWSVAEEVERVQLEVMRLAGELE